MANNVDRPNDSASSTILVVLALLSALLVLAWYLGSSYIAWGTVQTTLFLKQLLIPFTFLYSPDMANFIINMESHLEQNMNYSTVTVSEVVFLQEIAFRSIQVILIPLLIWRGVSNLVFSKTKAFNRRLDINQLAEIQASRYPRMKPVNKAKLLEQDHRFGPWATSRNPLPYLIHNNLVTDIDDPDLALIGEKQFRDMDELEKLNQLKAFHGKLIIDQSGVTKLLVSQLGNRCAYSDNQIINIDALPKIERTTAILFLAARTQKKKYRIRINELLDQFGDSFVEGKPASENQDPIPHKIDLSGVDELWADVKNNSNVKRALLDISRTHAFWSTAFTAMFQFIYNEFRNLKARDFIFLKPVNRSLYLLCSQVGLEASRPETSAIRAHYRAEKKLGSPIFEPFITDQAYQLILSIQNEGWLSEDIVESEYENQLIKYAELCAQDLKDYESFNVESHH